MKFKVSAVLPIPAGTYFIERDSSAFRSLVAEMCKLESLEMGNSWMEGDTEVYEFVTKPDIHRYVPHQFKHFLPGGDLHYTDVIAYNPRSIEKSPYKMQVHSVPPIFPGKAKIESFLIIEEVTPETCRQTLEGTVDIKILGIGHVAEKIIVDNLKNVYKGVPHIVERWVKFRDEVLKQPGGRDVLIQGRPKNIGVGWINDQIRDLIKADDTVSEVSSMPSSRGEAESDDQLPSVDTMMDQCSIEASSGPASDESDNDIVFFDARENPTFMNLSENVQKSLHPLSSLDRSMEADRQTANQLMGKLQDRGTKVKKLQVDSSPLTEGHAVRVESQRFGKDYNEQLSQWREFWQEHQVPEAKHVKHSNFRQRLGNVFAIGAGAGMFKRAKSSSTTDSTARSQDGSTEHERREKEKRKHHRFHLRHKHKQSCENDRIVKSDLDLSSGAPHAEHLVCPVTYEGHDKDENKERQGHRRSHSGNVVKDLFTRRRSHDPPTASGP